jgi:hypothetical protein
MRPNSGGCELSPYAELLSPRLIPLPCCRLTYKWSFVSFFSKKAVFQSSIVRNKMASNLILLDVDAAKNI